MSFLFSELEGWSIPLALHKQMYSFLGEDALQTKEMLAKFFAETMHMLRLTH